MRFTVKVRRVPVEVLVALMCRALGCTPDATLMSLYEARRRVS